MTLYDTRTLFSTNHILWYSMTLTFKKRWKNFRFIFSRQIFIHMIYNLCVKIKSILLFTYIYWLTIKLKNNSEIQHLTILAKSPMARLANFWHKFKFKVSKYAFLINAIWFFQVIHKTIGDHSKPMGVKIYFPNFST